MAKKKSIDQILEEASLFLKTQKRVLNNEAKKSRGCKSHPDKIIYMKEMCKDCYEEATNTTLQAKINKEPWISTNGYKYCYDEVGKTTLYHRLIAESYLSRELRTDEKLSFIDGDKSNCEVSNLAILIKMPITSLAPS